jgi:hypothetical protein
LLSGSEYEGQKGMINYTAADKKEMVNDARSYLVSRNIKPTARQIEAQIEADHGPTVSAMIARHLGMEPQPNWARLPVHQNVR